MFSGADTGRLGNQKWIAERLLKVRRFKGRLGRTQTQPTNGHRGRRSPHCSTRPTHASSRRVAPQRAMPPAEQQTCEGVLPSAAAQWRIDRFRRFKRRLKRTGPRPDDEHGPRIRFEFHDWAFVCIGSTVTTLRPDFQAPVARRVVGLRSQFRVEALVWPLFEGIRTRHCHLRHRVSPTEPGDRCESASLDIQTGEATTDNVYRCASCHSD